MEQEVEVRPDDEVIPRHEVVQERPQSPVIDFDSVVDVKLAIPKKELHSARPSPPKTEEKTPKKETARDEIARILRTPVPKRPSSLPRAELANDPRSPARNQKVPSGRVRSPPPAYILGDEEIDPEKLAPLAPAPAPASRVPPTPRVVSKVSATVSSRSSQEARVPSVRPTLGVTPQAPTPQVAPVQPGEVKQDVPLVLTPEQEKERRSELMVRFGIIRKNYPAIELPVFPFDADLQLMDNTYKKVVQRIVVDEAADSYRIYLLVLIGLMEVAAVKMFGLDIMKGFAKSQFRSMSKYQKLLTELGEKNYGGLMSTWPVEGRIFFLVCLNGVFFCVAKSLFGNLGEEGFSLVETALAGRGGLAGGIAGAGNAPGAEAVSRLEKGQEGGGDGGGFQNLIGGLMGALGGGSGAGGGLGDLLGSIMGGGKKEGETAENPDEVLREPPKRRRRRKPQE